jgi:hypothetical protein
MSQTAVMLAVADMISVSAVCVILHLKKAMSSKQDAVGILVVIRRIAISLASAAIGSIIHKYAARMHSVGRVERQYLRCLK